MAEILLCSEKFVKEETSINDNLNAKFLRPSLREAQEKDFKQVVGGCLLQKLKDLVASGDITLPANAMYKELLDMAQYFLAYTALARVAVKVSYKIGNLGVAKTADTNIYSASQDEVSKLQYYYQASADGYCLDLQKFILANIASYPEVASCTCDQMRANLRSAASCGIWLGGARGKILRGGECCDASLGRRVR